LELGLSVSVFLLHILLKHMYKRIGLQCFNLNHKKDWLKTTQAYTAGQKASGLITQKTCIASLTNRSILNDETNTNQQERSKLLGPLPKA
jgi:hypothetical protein